MLNLKETAQALRAETLAVAKKLDELRKQPAASLTEGSAQKANPGEIIANITLAYRHLEDARMRLGKAIQEYDGGESCYPK